MSKKLIKNLLQLSRIFVICYATAVLMWWLAGEHIVSAHLKLPPFPLYKPWGMLYVIVVCVIALLVYSLVTLLLGKQSTAN